MRDSQRVEAGFNRLLEQSHITAQEYFREAEQFLKSRNVKYTTAEVLELAKMAADDFNQASMLIASQNISDAVRDAVREIISHDWS